AGRCGPSRGTSAWLSASASPASRIGRRSSPLSPRRRQPPPAWRVSCGLPGRPNRNIISTRKTFKVLALEERRSMERREVLIQASVLPMLQAPPQAGGRPGLKITDIKTYLVGLPGRNLLFVKVETDQGIHGIGEAYSCGPDEATVAAIHDFRRWLVGQDP